MKQSFFLLLYLLFTTSFWAQMLVDEFAFNAISPFSSFGILTSFQGEKREAFTHPELHPLYKIEGFIQEKKNIWITRVAGNFSPISANCQIGIGVLFQFTQRFQLFSPFTLTVGTGWYDKTFGKGIGIASNFYDSHNKDNHYTQENLTKMYFKAAFGNYFTIAIIPNLLSVIFEQTLYYRYLLGTKSSQDVWLYENQGDNLKYFRYSASGMLTLAFPLLLQRISLFIQSDWNIQYYNDSPVIKSGWGSDLPSIRTGTVFGVGSKGLSLDLQLSWGNTPAYQEGYGYQLLLTERKIDPNVVQYWYLQKIALLFSWQI